MTESTSTALTAAKKGGLAVFAQGTANPFVGAAQREGVNDGVYVRLNGNTGDYVVTGEAEPIELGSYVAMLLYHAKVAWLGFDEDNKPHRGPEVTFLSGAELPPPPESDEIRWSKVIIVAIRGMGPDSKQMILTAKADKPSRPMWKLINRYGELMGRYLDDQGQHKIPIVEMGSRSFEMMVEEEKDGKKRKVKATKYSETYEIKDWATEAELAEIAQLQDGAGDDGEDAGEVGAVVDAAAPEEPAPAPAPSRPAASAKAAPAKSAATSSGGQEWRNRGRVGQRQ